MLSVRLACVSMFINSTHLKEQCRFRSKSAAAAFDFVINTLIIIL